jgi:hypothetical protein
MVIVHFESPYLFVHCFLDIALECDGMKTLVRSEDPDAAREGQVGVRWVDKYMVHSFP